ncbi:DsbA family protein [Marinilactibacillus sp. XAAS-LB27]|uniref:DsbA family protein n=1 Tax=Marinilactibacillus sp. XAAS-LB27 TaxID=3114538 RepID=UPI002E17F92A|nr:DsbA family protein [Marinilactibacillus sp. XAAS-LB27]
MSLNNVIEIFLFVNPLGVKSYEAEEVIETFSKERDEKVKIRFVPLLNFKSVKKQLLDEKYNSTSVENRNRLYTDSFNASLAFAAASMQGKKKARTFLMNLQESILNSNGFLTKSMMLDCAESAKLDTDMFEEDLESDLAKAAFTKDQKLAEEMAVKDTPACVLFNGSDVECGYRIETAITSNLLHGICSDSTLTEELPDLKNKYKFQMV